MPTHQTIPEQAKGILGRLLTDKASVILDVGANRGQSYKTYRTMFPNAHIVSFEPDPDTFALLKAAMAGDANASAVHAAVGASCGVVTLYRNSNPATNSLAPMADNSPWAKELNITRRDAISVPSVSIDAWLEERKLPAVDFAKFDIQGFEPSALTGMQKTLAERRVRYLQLELIPGAFYDRTTSFGDVERLLAPHGYRLVTIPRLALDDDGFLRACDVIYGL